MYVNNKEDMTMKRYIKPTTEFHKIELQQMIAATGQFVGGDTGNGDYHELGKETEFTTSSPWSDGDEEE